MNCPACGTDNREGARYCRRCGAALSQTAPQAEPAANEPIAAAEPAEPAGAQAPTELEAEAGEPAPAAVPAEPEAAPPASPDAAAGPDAGSELAAEAAPPTGPAEAEAPPPADESEEPEPPVDASDDAALFWRDGAQPLEAVAPGTVIDGRYAIVEALDVQDDHILYQAQDLQRCWQCGSDQNAPTEAFCARCGASLDRKLGVRLLQVRDPEAEPAGGEPVAARLTYEDRHFLVLEQARTAPPAPAAPQGVRLIAGQRSIPGQVRDLNEDSTLVLALSPVFQSRSAPALGLYAVADGMGGHEGGEIASKLTLQVFADRAVRDVILPLLAEEALADDAILARLSQAVGAANDAVYLARHKRETDMGTTLTAMLVRDQQLFVAHVGDSRGYKWNADGLKQLTNDHSVVASMVASGQITPDELYTHPHRSVIYRSIGDKPSVQVDTAVQTLAPGDRLIVCSDGLWEMIRNEGIQDGMMEESEPQALCERLAGRANAAGVEDNISVIVVAVEG